MLRRAGYEAISLKEKRSFNFKNYKQKSFDVKIPGDEVNCTNVLLLLMQILPCRKLESQKVEH